MRNNDDDPLPHAAKIRGRRLVHRALELRGEISKAATIRGAARFRGNTVSSFVTEPSRPALISTGKTSFSLR